MLRDRASYDLECPRDQLVITEIRGGLTGDRGVSGCNHRATYVFVDGTGWVMNNSSR